MANYEVASHTYTNIPLTVQNNVWFFFFWHPLLVRPAMKSLFLPKPWLCLAPYPTLCPCEPLRPVGDMQAVSYGARSGQYSPLLPASRPPARNLDLSSSDHALGPWVGFIYIFLFLAPYARTTRYEEVFLPEGKKRPRSLRSLGLASL